MSDLHAEPKGIDELIDRVSDVFRELPVSNSAVMQSELADLRARLSEGRLRLVVLGQFNRGKSTFINALLGAKILPTSILPLTSIPTVIRASEVNSCTISFSSDTPPVTAFESTQHIHDLLLKYVAEENNPKNRLGVSLVTVDYCTTFLDRGTVLIDTPGFGSTHAHNTRTTADLLKGSDAALFLLGADLPITQTEIDFLREVQREVPRIYFILNKVDLLTADDLEQMRRFICSVITEQLVMAAGIPLFAVSARIGVKAKSFEESDLAWRQSGMGVVKREIVDFLRNEKYFTLSQALSNKLADLLKGAIADNAREHAELVNPQAHLDNEVTALGGIVEKFHARIQRERELLQHEKIAVIEFMEKFVAGQKKELTDRLIRAIHGIVGLHSNARTLASTILSILPDFAVQLCDTAHTAASTAVNRPLHKACTMHQREFENLLHQVNEAILKTTPLYCNAEALTDLELALDGPWGYVDTHIAEELVRHCAARPFESSVKRQSRIDSVITQDAALFAERCALALTTDLRSAIEKLFLRITETFDLCTRIPLDKMDGLLKHKISVQQDLHKRIAPQEKLLLEQRKRLEAIWVEMKS